MVYAAQGNRLGKEDFDLARWTLPICRWWPCPRAWLMLHANSVILSKTPGLIRIGARVGVVANERIR